MIHKTSNFNNKVTLSLQGIYKNMRLMISGDIDKNEFFLGNKGCGEVIFGVINYLQ